MPKKMRFAEATLTACLAVINADSIADADDKRRLGAYLESVMHGGETATGIDDIPEVLSFDHAAKMLGCSKRYVYKLIASGALRGVYGGKNRARARGVAMPSVREYLGMEVA